MKTLRELGKLSAQEFLSSADRIGNAKYHFVRLVHLCWAVDDALVHEYLRDAVDDLEEFGKTIAKHPW